jgi:hypothetical protein
VSRLINILFAFDCLILALITLGKSYPSESISSAAYRAELFGRTFGFMRPVIDRIMWFDPEHCKRAYGSAKLNLPEDER